MFRQMADYLARHRGRGFGGRRGSFVSGGLAGLKAQVHRMQPQGLPAVGRVHTAVEPRPQTGFGCLPAQGPGGHSLAATSDPRRTAVTNVAATPAMARKRIVQCICLCPPMRASCASFASGEAARLGQERTTPCLETKSEYSLNLGRRGCDIATERAGSTGSRRHATDRFRLGRATRGPR